MFFDDHNPPHFHAEYGEYKATIKIKDFTLTKGYLPPRALGLVIEWAALHQEELLSDWELARNNQSLLTIDALK
jgi:phosphomannomutase